MRHGGHNLPDTARASQTEMAVNTGMPQAAQHELWLEVAQGASSAWQIEAGIRLGLPAGTSVAHSPHLSDCPCGRSSSREVHAPKAEVPAGKLAGQGKAKECGPAEEHDCRSGSRCKAPPQVLEHKAARQHETNSHPPCGDGHICKDTLQQAGKV